MAKSGPSSRLVAEGTGRSAATKRSLVAAAIETLKTEGFAGASARAIAARAGCNQALIFYHFGSVVTLLLAALDEVSASRLERYSAAPFQQTDLELRRGDGQAERSRAPEVPPGLPGLPQQ